MLLTQKLKLHCQLTDLLKRVRKLEQYYKSYKIGKVEPEKKIGLDVRIYNCNGCDLVIDRDHNAALNILKMGSERTHVEKKPLRKQASSMKHEAHML